VLNVSVHFAASAGSIGGAVLETAARQVYRGERLGEASITYVITNDPGIRDINRRFLRHDYATDVITFPLDESRHEAEIYISIDTARRQAREFCVGVREEVTRLAIHGFLHLCGHDDRMEADRERMTAAQERYVAQALRARTKRKVT
jgi:probable rRNA maturation factor